MNIETKYCVGEKAFYVGYGWDDEMACKECGRTYGEKLFAVGELVIDCIFVTVTPLGSLIEYGSSLGVGTRKIQESDLFSSREQAQTECNARNASNQQIHALEKSYRKA